MRPSLQPSLHTSVLFSVLFNTILLCIDIYLPQTARNNTIQTRPLIDTLFIELKHFNDMILIKVRLLKSHVYRGFWNLAKVCLSAPFLTQFLKLIVMLLVGSLDVLPNSQQLNLLPSPPPSPTQPPIRYPACRR